MTKDATYAYGDYICECLSLQHDPKRPQQINILNGKKIIQVDSGKSFIVVLTDDGSVYLASDDSFWQTKNTLRLISTDNDRFEMIACGYYHLLLLRKDGIVFAFGYNKYGQLTGNSDSSYFTLVNTGLKNVKIIACGAGHCLALTNTNEIYSWGWNEYGQLGLGDTNNRRTPSLVSFPDGSIDSPIKNIVAGAWHSLFLLEDGQIFGCGYGQHRINDNAKVPTKIPIENVQSVACTNYYLTSLALDHSSHYYRWGRLNTKELVPLKKLDGQLKSFAAASVMQYKSSITYGLTSTIYSFESYDTISIIGLLDNPDNYDVKFVIDDKRILACKCYLKMSSEYYSRMFSGDWQENDQVIIKDYSYYVYYSYLHMLHTGRIRIDRYNIAELIDLANCYGDERLIKHCRTFIRTDLNKHTLRIYLPLINKYELDGMKDKLIQLTIENVLPKITNNLLENKENNEFLELLFLSDNFSKKICEYIGLLDNPDNYDVKFVIDDKRILARKCYLKMSSKYYNRMFSGDWQENDQVIIKDYSYDIYYSYLVMLHTGRIRINQSNIAKLIDLANCYGDERLMKHCRTFIRRDLNKQTLCIYLPIISKYELDDMHDKLVELTIKDVLPKITNNLSENKKNIIEFLELFFLSDNLFLKKICE
uniref:RCC1 and BTB domain-containing protein 2-like n=1 Tax=Dermatophagoides pteronyssinus TaxID=6956 RepID=A0A6P6YJE1_DERPT|nr:RCC1 and BTB domain-containing protein 2-like [Dermatophagoides pteronyssinus]